MADGIVAWPMYAVDPVAVEQFWHSLQYELRSAGLESVPDQLTWPEDLYDHWRSPNLLFSQTCGYPFVTRLREQVRYVATPCFDAPGCSGAFYSSAIVIRVDDTVTDIAGCAGRCAAFNATDSQSGYNALRALVAPLATEGRFFAEAIETGAHRLSLAALKSGRAALAAVDAVTLALIGDRHPSEIEGLRVLAYTDRAPGLPFVTSLKTSDADLERLRQALSAVCNRKPGGKAGGRLRLDGIAILPPEAYNVIDTMRAEAFAMGYSELG